MSLVGLDIGTSGCKGLVISEDGAELASGRREYPLSFPGRGRVELAPNAVWEQVQDLLRALAFEAKRKYDPIRAVCFSVSGDEAVPVDAFGAPLYPCIMSMDSRTVDLVTWWEREVGRERIYRITGQPVNTIYPLLRLMWLREHEPEVYARTERLLCWEELLEARLGVEPITDESVATRTMAFDIEHREWSAELCGLAGVPVSLFPACRPSGSAIGEVPASLADDLGLGRSTLVVTGGFDQCMAALGAGRVAPGDASVGTGTWEALTVVTDRLPLSPAMLAAGYAFGCYVVNGLYYCLASNAGGGSLLRWFRDQLGQMDVMQAHSSGADAFDVILQTMPERPTHLLVLPHFEGAHSPWMDPAATGAIVGLRLDTTRGDLVKGILEGITFELRENIERMEAAGVAVHELRATGGGAKSAAWLQLKADVTGKPIVTVNVKETGCFAAACLAGVGAGSFASAEEPLSAFVRPVQVYEPRGHVKDEYDTIFPSYQQLYSALQPVNHSLPRTPVASTESLASAANA